MYSSFLFPLTAVRSNESVKLLLSSLSCWQRGKRGFSSFAYLCCVFGFWACWSSYSLFVLWIKTVVHTSANSLRFAGVLLHVRLKMSPQGASCKLAYEDTRVCVCVCVCVWIHYPWLTGSLYTLEYIRIITLVYTQFTVCLLIKAYCTLTWHK